MNKYLRAFAVVILAAGCAAHRLGPVQFENGINFTLSAPTATSVAIAGSFNRWDTHRDQLSGPDHRGVWSITLPLPPGRHEYLFFINGKTWMLDPSAPSTNDDMGGENSELIVGESAP
jgi:1,4-alpha-glucan branching enzyme